MRKIMALGAYLVCAALGSAPTHALRGDTLTQQAPADQNTQRTSKGEQDRQSEPDSATQSMPRFQKIVPRQVETAADPEHAESQGDQQEAGYSFDRFLLDVRVTDVLIVIFTGGLWLSTHNLWRSTNNLARDSAKQIKIAQANTDA